MWELTWNTYRERESFVVAVVSGQHHDFRKNKFSYQNRARGCACKEQERASGGMAVVDDLMSGVVGAQRESK